MILQSDYQLMKNSTPLWIFSRHMSGSIVDPFRNEYVDTSWDRYNIVIPPTRQHFSRISLALDSDLSNHRTVHVKKNMVWCLANADRYSGKVAIFDQARCRETRRRANKIFEWRERRNSACKKKEHCIPGVHQRLYNILTWTDRSQFSLSSSTSWENNSNWLDSESWAHV